MKNISKIVTVLGITGLLFTGCGNSERKEAVKNINDFSQEYEEAKDDITQDKMSNYQMLGESVQALLDISEKDSGELETEEQIAQANELVEELRAELYEMTGSVEESQEDSETAGEVVEAVITFRNDSQTGAFSLSVLDPQSGMEKELDSFEAGKKIETTVKLPVDALKISWYLYNESGECTVQETTNLEDIKSGATIYYTEDGVYTEVY